MDFFIYIITKNQRLNAKANSSSHFKNKTAGNVVKVEVRETTTTAHNHGAYLSVNNK